MINVDCGKVYIQNFCDRFWLVKRYIQLVLFQYFIVFVMIQHVNLDKYGYSSRSHRQSRILKLEIKALSLDTSIT